MDGRVSSAALVLLVVVAFVAYQVGYARGHDVVPPLAEPIHVDLDAILYGPGPEALFCEGVLDLAEDHLEWRHATDQAIRAEGMPHD